MFKKSWLRNRTHSEIKKNYNELYKSRWKNLCFRFSELIVESKNWWIVILTVLSIYIISGLLNINFLNILEIKYETAKILVDQRASNIATIISITLVVVGFMINNLAVKEPFAYRLLFKKSYLYPIIYFILSVIGFFIILSTLRDHLNEFLFVRLVLTGTYLAIVVLFVIGSLFATIIKFSNKNEIKKLFRRELTSEAYKHLKLHLLEKTSKQIFNDTLQSIGLKKYDFWNNFNISNSTKVDVGYYDDKQQPKEVERKVVYDIDIEGIAKIVKNSKTKDLSYKELFIGDITTSPHESIIDLDEKSKNKLKKCFTLKKVRNKESENNNLARTFFDEKIDEYSSNGNHKDLEDILDAYYELYEIEIKYQL
ncbi:hypothetical protein IP98_01573 [Flavobacterium cauense R2A-7]|uniref:Uncharacterized protein n=2 Tax=Flavobacterium TaxID=237 RepID=A0A562LXI3_9FLAO|nr:hypothetical protein Q762_00405 [Flavobacterium cauense R2A-7]TWI12361.1 hypothetical protein IP98_01573 [Flavobacterium cauense R2A-7]